MLNFNPRSHHDKPCYTDKPKTPETKIDCFTFTYRFLASENEASALYHQQVLLPNADAGLSLCSVCSVLSKLSLVVPSFGVLRCINNLVFENVRWFNM